MSGALDKKAIKTASKLISKFCDAVSYTEITSDYDINTGGMIEEQQTFNNIPAQISKPTIKDLNGTLITVNDLMVKIASSDITFTPKNGDIVTVDSKAYTVMGNLYIKGQAIIYHNLICKA